MSRFSLIYLSSFFLLISLLSFINILYSYYFNLYLNIDTYVYTLIISLLLSVPAFIKKKDEKKTNIYEKIITIILGYILIPTVISIPYFLSIYNISFLDCYFESISGFTSTGFTIFSNIKHLDQSLILWRSTSQWIGGLYFLFSIILLIDIFDKNLKNNLTEFLSFDSSEILKQSFKVIILYSLLTLFIFLILKFINIRNFDAFNLSLTLISSGGFLPVNNLDMLINSELKQIVLSFLMLITFFSLFLSFNLVYFKQRGLSVFTEDFYLFLYFIFINVIFFIFFDNNDYSSIFLSISSSISNIGFSSKSIPNNLYFIFLILVIIGGSFFSTSSGLRFIKIFSLIKFSINELLSHSRPRQVYLSKIAFSKDYVNQIDINKYFLSILIFVVSLITVTILLTISNLNFDTAFKLGILSIMNTVNSNMYGLGDFYFLKTSYFSKMTLIVFMIIGRVELLTFLIIAKKFLFKN
tara:strand:+ start:1271 stop:2674 length:1404 start_codon:yes stop_codon:yes gene_type:complete